MDKKQIIRLLKILLEEELAQEKRLLTLGEVEVLTINKGLAVRLEDGKKFQITVN